MATNQLLRFAHGTLPNVISYAEWAGLPEVNQGFVSGIAKSANMNRVFAQGALASYVMGQAIVTLLDKDATLESDTFYADFMTAAAKYVSGNITDGSIATIKLSERATKQDIEDGTAMRVVCADVVKQYFDVVCPPGMIGFFHATDVPEGWLLCNGAAVSRTTYARLFAKIGTKYGTGNGSTTFNLPNLDGRVLQGTTNTGNVGAYLEASLPNITGGFHDNRSDTLWPNAGAPNAFWSSGKTEESYDLYQIAYDTRVDHANVITFDASRNSSIYNGTAMQPKALNALPCIRF